MRFCRFGLFFLLGLIPCLLIWGFLIEPDLLIVRRWTVESANWPTDLPELTLIALKAAPPR